MTHVQSQMDSVKGIYNAVVGNPAVQTTVSAVSNVGTAVVGDAKQRDLSGNIVEDAKSGNYITTDFGTRISDTDNSLKGGERGPTLLEDFHFREKTTHFDHERIPERVVHARGVAAHGYFENYENLSELTSADLFQRPGERTPVFTRFSTVAGSRGSADTVRDVRGFAVKFYTQLGNWDLVGNNIPIFFIQDAIKFSDLIHAAKPEPHNEIPQAQTAHDNFWDFASLTPETTAMSVWTMSDRAIPRSLRTMQGFGIHSFLLVNAQGKRRFVKFHWLPKLGIHSLVWDEAQKITGADPDFHRRDLYEAIENGAYPEWELGFQIVEEEDEHKFDFDILDSTKLIPEELVPIRKVGKLVLNRNPDNYFAETEQVAFCTQHVVPGIDFSNDPLLQGRNHSYLDTQISRLGGPNFQEIPINRPVCPVTNNQRDGAHRMIINKGKVNYFPNRFGCPALASAAEGGYVHAPTMVNGPKIRARGPKFQEHFSQARLFYNSLALWEKDHVIKSYSFELGHVDDLGVREKFVSRLNCVDLDLAQKVAVAIGVKPPTEFQGVAHDKKSPALSQANQPKDTIATRKIALLVGPGYKSAQLKTVRAALAAAGATTVVIGTHKGDQGHGDDAQFTFQTCKSVLFDGIVLVGGTQYEKLGKTGEVLQFVSETFKHCKPIGAIEEGVDFLQRFGFVGINLAGPEEAVKTSQGVVTTRKFAQDIASIGEALNWGKAFFDAVAAHRHWERYIDPVQA